MADTPAAPAPATPNPAYVEVALKRAVMVQGHTYRPGQRNVVDQATLAAMGDAVASSSPVDPAPPSEQSKTRKSAAPKAKAK